MVTEVLHVELVVAARLYPDNLSQFFENTWLPIWCKPHDLVFVSPMRKSEVLGHRHVEDSQRMGKINLIVEVQPACAAKAPRSARKVAKTIDRDSDRLFER